MSNFPPRTTHEREVEAALAVLAGAIEGRGATYVSAPITSGRRFSAWVAGRDDGFEWSRLDHVEALKREVVAHNREHASRVVCRLRRDCAGVLVDPTAVPDLPGWTQDDYRDLWGRVVERFASRVVFVDGWEHSNGCSYEFLVACRCGIPSFNERLRPVEPAEGLRMIEAAAAEMRGRSLRTDFLERVAEELRRLAAQGAARR